MRSESIEELIRGHRDIEFKYKGEWYSITPSDLEAKEDFVSFCKFYEEPIDIPFERWPDVLKIKIGSLTIGEVLSQLPDDAFVIG